GIGLRTLQRIESSGKASNESLAAIAAAFGTRAANLLEAASGYSGELETVRHIAQSLPEVKDASNRLGVALKYKGRLLACEAIDRSAEPDSLMLTISQQRRRVLL